jgi:hypothetical protein
MEISNKGKRHRPPKPTHKKLVPHKRSRFPFENLPLEVRLNIYDKLTSEALIFHGEQPGRRTRWPKNPLAALAMCYPQFQKEINLRLYSTTRFVFYDSRNRYDRTYGYQVAARFFARIGPANLSFVKQVYCHFHWTHHCKYSPQFFRMLSLIASSDPPRNVRHLHLSFEKTTHVKPFKEAQLILRPCFVLHGFLGVQVTLIFPRSRDRVSVTDLNAWITSFHDGGSPVNFLTALPGELRTEIYRYLAPDIYRPKLARLRHKPKTPGWVSVNRQMSLEVCSVMYRECQFEFHLISWSDPNRDQFQNQERIFTKFLRQIGRRNARQIRHLEIFLNIYPRVPLGHIILTPPIADIVQAINKICGIRIGTYSVPASLVAGKDSDMDSHGYQFRIPTRAGTMLMMNMRVKLVGSGPQPSTDRQACWAASCLRESLCGRWSYVP